MYYTNREMDIHQMRTADARAEAETWRMLNRSSQTPARENGLQGVGIMLFALVLITFFLTTGCSRPGSGVEQKGSSSLTRRTVAVADFDRIHVGVVGEIVIEQTGEESLAIETAAPYQHAVKAEVRGNTLYLETRRSFFWRRLFSGALRAPELHVTIGVDDLHAIEMDGVGKLHVGDLATDDLAVHLEGMGLVDIQHLNAEMLTVRLDGAGDIAVSGNVTTQSVHLNAMGTYTADELRSDTAWVGLRGAGAAHVWVVEELTASTEGLGDIRYKGTPDVKTLGWGLGRAVALDR